MSVISPLRREEREPRPPSSSSNYDWVPYPRAEIQLHEDHDGLHGHFRKEKPALNEKLLSERGTETVFAKNDTAIQRAKATCITDAFFAGQDKGLYTSVVRLNFLFF